MFRSVHILGVLVTLAWSMAALAHDGHGATPAHVHTDGGLPVDVGAAIAAIIVGGGALALAKKKQRR